MTPNDISNFLTTVEGIKSSRQQRALNERTLDPNSPQNVLARQKMDIEQQKLQQQQQEFSQKQLLELQDFGIRAFSHMAEDPSAARLYKQQFINTGFATPEEVAQFESMAPEQQQAYSADIRDKLIRANQQYMQANRQSKLYTPEEMAQRQALASAGRTSINVNTGDNIPLTKTQESKNQDLMFTAQGNVERLKAIGNDFADNFLTYEGRLKGAWSGFKEKAGFELSKDDKKYLSKFTDFTTKVMRFFNAYRKEITGAAAAVQELEQLKKSVINGDMSPTEFKASFNSLMDGFNGELQRYYGYSDSGIPKTYGESPIDSYSQQQQPVAPAQPQQNMQPIVVDY